MPELEIIKAARYISNIWSLLALVMLVIYLAGGKALAVSAVRGGRSVPWAFRAAVLSKVFWFGIVVVGAGVFIKVLPVFAFRDTPVHGVVLRKGAQTTVAAAQISLDGLSELGTTTDNNGNFQLRVPAGRRQDDYTVRAQLGGEGGSAKVTDADAPKTSVKIELPAPADYGWVTVNVPEGWSLRAVLQRLADGDKSTIVYGKGCTKSMLSAKVRPGELRARGTAAVMEQLTSRLVTRPVSFSLRVTHEVERGHYEIECIE